MSPNSIQTPQPHHSQGALAAKIQSWEETPQSLTVLVEKQSGLITEFFAQLNILCELSQEWPSKQATPLAYNAAVNSARLFAEIMTEQTPSPQLVPTNRGNLQFEWHLHDVDLELEVTEGGELICCFEDLRTGSDTEWQASFSHGVALLRSIMETLVNRAIESTSAKKF